MGDFRGCRLRLFKNPTALVATLLLVLVGSAFLTQVVPYRQIMESERQVADASSRLADLTAENERLQADVAALGTDAEIERLAREKLGYVMPGETAYVVLDPPGSAELAPQPVEEPLVEDKTWVDAVWDFLTGADIES